jgi:hypothetical protein
LVWVVKTAILEATRKAEDHGNNHSGLSGIDHHLFS